MACDSLPLPIVITVLLVTGNVATGQDTASKGTVNIISLYSSLHQAILPNGLGSFGDLSPVMQRFIMRYPGAVIYPAEYEADTLEKKSFDLSDSVPGFNPLAGNITDDSFVTQYRRALDSVRFQGSDELPEVNRKKYLSARDALSAKQVDPANEYNNITRLDLYQYYQSEYIKKQLELKTLEGNDSTRILAQNEATAAYYDWVVHGEKAEVEKYLSYLRLLPTEQALEKAQEALDNSRVSLPDSEDIYPVSFSPSNWLDYIQHNM